MKEDIESDYDQTALKAQASIARFRIFDLRLSYNANGAAETTREPALHEATAGFEALSQPLPDVDKNLVRLLGDLSRHFGDRLMLGIDLTTIGEDVLSDPESPILDNEIRAAGGFAQ